jgi:DNA-binding MarR family transcriptional regulator
MDKLPRGKDGTAPLEPLLLVPRYLAQELVKLARRISTEIHANQRLRLGHTAALACLADRGPLSQRDLSESLRFDPGDIVGIVDTLEELEFVVRGRDPRDRRRHAVKITPAGREALREGRERLARLDAALFAPLSADEIDQLRALLLRVLAYHDPRFVEAAARAATENPPDTD